MSKKIVLIQSHCNTEEKKTYLLKNIQKLKTFDVDILLFSHIPLPENIISEVDFFVYDKSNPILDKDRWHHYWWANNDIMLERTLPDYGWTVFNQLIRSYDLIRRINYEYVFIFCYDTIIDDVIEDSIKNPKTGVFKHIKPETVNNVGEIKPVIFDTALIFSVFKKDEYEKLINSFSLEEYVSKTEFIAEKYFEVKMMENNIYSQTDMCVKDFFSESDDIFNLTKDKEYGFFVDNNDLLKFRLLKDSDTKIKIIINDDLVNVNCDNYFYNKKIDNLNTFGCIVNDRYDNWLDLVSPNISRNNKIKILK
jgi:hypothetical protein